jgi:hypothetical protein
VWVGGGGRAGGGGGGPRAGGGGRGGEITQALYAHMNNKIIKKKSFHETWNDNYPESAQEDGLL